MPEWLWYVILGANLGSMASCWYTIVWYSRRDYAQMAHWWQREAEQWERWQRAYRRLARDAACRPDDETP